MNADGVCNTPDEDKNGDGECNALDCHGDLGVGAVYVYDSSDPPQYLGILLSLEPEQPGGDIHIAEIFIPSLNIATIITENNTAGANQTYLQTNDSAYSR